MIYFRCPTCRILLRAPAELADQQAACRCGQRLWVPPSPGDQRYPACPAQDGTSVTPTTQRRFQPALFVSSLGRGLLALGWLSMFCFGIFPPLLLLLVIGEFGLGGNMHKRQH